MAVGVLNEVVVNPGSSPGLFGDRLRVGYDKPAFQFDSGVGEDRRDFLNGCVVLMGTHLACNQKLGVRFLSHPPSVNQHRAGIIPLANNRSTIFEGVI